MIILYEINLLYSRDLVGYLLSFYNGEYQLATTRTFILCPNFSILVYSGFTIIIHTGDEH